MGKLEDFIQSSGKKLEDDWERIRADHPELKLSPQKNPEDMKRLQESMLKEAQETALAIATKLSGKSVGHCALAITLTELYLMGKSKKADGVNIYRAARKTTRELFKEQFKEYK